MKQPANYNIGSHPTWLHIKNGVIVFTLPNVGEDGLKFGIHEHSPEMEKKYPVEKEYIEMKLKEVQGHMDEYYKDQYESMKRVEKCYYTGTKS